MLKWGMFKLTAMHGPICNPSGLVLYMQIPAEISFRDFPHSDAVEARIKEKINKLEQYCNRIISCRVVLQSPHRHHHKGKLYKVLVQVALPGRLIVVGRDTWDDQPFEDIYVAIRDSFEAARRQLKKHIRQRRGRYVNGRINDGEERVGNL